MENKTISNLKSPVWLNFLPFFLREKIKHNSGLHNIINNIIWLVFDKVLRMAVGLFVGVWVARYLGPERYGIFNYAIAITGMFAAVATLGMDNIVIRNIVREPDARFTQLGTAFVMKSIGGIVAYLLIICTVFFLRPKDTITLVVTAIIGAQVVFKSFEVIKSWFNSQVKSKFSVIAENSAFAIIAGINVILILKKASLTAFAWAFLTQMILGSIFLIGMYHYSKETLFKWHFNFKLAGNLLADSWPLILSGIAVMIYMRIDQIMLAQMSGDAAVGIYSAAVRISEIWYFIPVAIVSSTFPAILKSKAKSETLYYNRLQRLFNLMALISIGMAVIITFSSTLIIHLLYGDQYADSSNALSLLIWAGVFVCMGFASTSWLMSENLQILNFYRTMLGAVFNVVLNLLLIPKYGVNGAAVATVVSYGVAAFMLLFFKRSEKVGRMLLRSLLPLPVLRIIR